MEWSPARAMCFGGDREAAARAGRPGREVALLSADVGLLPNDAYSGV